MTTLLQNIPSFTSPSWEEWTTSDPLASAAVAHLRSFLTSYSPEELESLLHFMRKQMREQGITYGLENGWEKEGRQGRFPFDLLPLPLAAQEWKRLAEGVAQRIRTWNAFLHDVFSEQEILKAGVIPFELVYSDPCYHRGCIGIPLPRDVHVHVAAVDLVRQASGQWAVMEDNLSNPAGASYAIQNRRVLSQHCPQMFYGQLVEPIFDFPTQLLDTLQTVAPSSTAAARVVALSPGVAHPVYYDHGDLARQMGIPVVQETDLIVLNGELYLKTIGGLERVDVLYRRAEGNHLDPIAFSGDSPAGIPGLVSCLRKGTLTVANALGAGLGDNRALAAYLPAMMRFYGNEKPLLESIPIYRLSDIDAREAIYDQWDHYVFKQVSSRKKESVWLGDELTETEWALLHEKINTTPDDFIAQPLIHFSTAPSWVEGQLQSRHVSIRTFVLNNGKPCVSPCILTRVAKEPNSLRVSPVSGGGSKDTWLLRDSEKKKSSAPLVMWHPLHQMPLASRTAESIYWMARYIERVEATVCVLQVVQQLSLEEASENTKTWQPLWEALASATGHPTSFFKKASFQKQSGVALADYILFEEKNESSVIASMRCCLSNAQLVREVISPEVWAVMNRLYLDLEAKAHRRQSSYVQGILADLSFHNRILSRLHELSGVMNKHMLRKDVWHFWRIGHSIESAFFTLLTTRQVFVKREDERQIGQVVPQDRNLDALLAMLAGQYIYLSAYQARPLASRVAFFLLQEADFPRSVTFCLRDIQEALEQMFGNRPPVLAERPMVYVSHLLAEVRFAEIAQYFSGNLPRSKKLKTQLARKKRMRAFADWLDTISERLTHLGSIISDHFFDHQSGAPAEAEDL